MSVFHTGGERALVFRELVQNCVRNDYLRYDHAKRVVSNAARTEQGEGVPRDGYLKSDPSIITEDKPAPLAGGIVCLGISGVLWVVAIILIVEDVKKRKSVYNEEKTAEEKVED